MSEQIPPAPEPDVPELVQYYRFARNYLAREGKVIREAKGTFGIAALAIVAATIWLTWRAAGTFFEERAVVLEKTIEYQKAQIDDLKNRVQTVAPVPIHTQVIPMLLKFFPAADGKRPYANFAIMNVSSVPARGPSSKGFMMVSDKVLTPEEEDKTILALKAEVSQTNPKSGTNQLAFGEYTYTSAFNKEAGDDQKIAEVKEGGKYLYIFFVAQFTDDNQPKDEKYIMERCAVYSFSLDVSGTCNGHNQTYVEKIK